MKKDILNDIANAIFQRTPMTLKKREAAFVDYQVKHYRRYQDTIREKVLPIMDKKKFSTREYNIIREWFFKTIPLYVVTKAIDACLENSRGTGRAIYSLAFFKAHVIAEFRYWLRLRVGSRYFQDPWGYHEWKN